MCYGTLAPTMTPHRNTHWGAVREGEGKMGRVGEGEMGEEENTQSLEL